MDVEVSSKKLHQPIAHSFKIQCTICISNQMLFEFAPFWNIDCKILLPRINMNMPLPDFAEFRPTFNLGLTQMCISNRMLFKFAHFPDWLQNSLAANQYEHVSSRFWQFQFQYFGLGAEGNEKKTPIHLSHSKSPSISGAFTCIMPIPWLGHHVHSKSFNLFGIRMHCANPMTWASPPPIQSNSFALYKLKYWTQAQNYRRLHSINYWAQTQNQHPLFEEKQQAQLAS